MIPYDNNMYLSCLVSLSPATRHDWESIVRRRRHIVHHSSFIVHHSSFIIHHSSYWLFTIAPCVISLFRTNSSTNTNTVWHMVACLFLRLCQTDWGFSTDRCNLQPFPPSVIKLLSPLWVWYHSIIVSEYQSIRVPTWLGGCIVACVWDIRLDVWYSSTTDCTF